MANSFILILSILFFVLLLFLSTFFFNIAIVNAACPDSSDPKCEQKNTADYEIKGHSALGDSVG